MPRRVEHEQRRQEITEALLRVAATRGLHAAGMREVAAEAGISVRLIQYYFGTKAALLLYGLQYLGERFGERVQAHLHGVGEAATVRDVIEAILVAALPTDEASRTFHLVYTAYAVLAMTDPGLAAQPFVAGPNSVECSLREKLHAAQDAGEVAPDLEVSAEVAGLLAMSGGLGTSVLVGQRSADAALATLRYHLDRIFEKSAVSR